MAKVIEPAISINPAVQIGTPCLTGTRIPASILVRYWLERGDGAASWFAHDCPDVPVHEVLDALRWLHEAILTYMLVGVRLDRAIEQALKRATKEEG